MPEQELDVSLIGRGLTVILLVLSLRQQPHDYYVVVRCSVAASAAYCCYLAGKKDLMGWAEWFFVLAFLFNPFLPVTLRRETWAVIDVAVAFFVLASMPCVRRNALGARQTSVATYSKTS